ncbi:hypothetical protein HY624_03070 [Candidatus Uhrbacteria bacterium]|nr:hypothetical protein [Candidatus Uhrbacteria bacterium]
MERIELTLTPQPGLPTTITCTPRRVTVGRGYAQPVSALVSARSWRKLHKLLKRLRARRWRRRYENLTVLDGITWSLSVDEPGMRVRSGGVNSYPPDGTGPVWSPAFKQLVMTM